MLDMGKFELAPMFHKNKKALHMSTCPLSWGPQTLLVSRGSQVMDQRLQEGLLQFHQVVLLTPDFFQIKA